MVIPSPAASPWLTLTRQHIAFYDVRVAFPTVICAMIGAL